MRRGLGCSHPKRNSALDKPILNLDGAATDLEGKGVKMGMVRYAAFVGMTAPLLMNTGTVMASSPASSMAQVSPSTEKPSPVFKYDQACTTKPSSLENGPLWSEGKVLSQTIAGISLRTPFSMVARAKGIGPLNRFYSGDDDTVFSVPYGAKSAIGLRPWIETWSAGIHQSVSDHDLTHLTDMGQKSFINKNVIFARGLDPKGKMVVGAIRADIPRPMPTIETELKRIFGRPTARFLGGGSCEGVTFLTYGTKDAPRSAESFMHYSVCRAEGRLVKSPMDCSPKFATQTPWMGIRIDNNVAHIYLEDGSYGYRTRYSESYKDTPARSVR